MKIIELYFNPKAKKEVVYDSFIFEPENAQEKNLGNLYIAGEFTNVLPQNSKLLNDLAKIIKTEYYTENNANDLTPKRSELNLKNGLKKANQFLTQKTNKGNTSWLGNLNFVAISLNDFILNFTKIGNIKILLLKTDYSLDENDEPSVEIIDIGTNLEFQNTKTCSSETFGNIATGMLSPNDKIMILTNDAFNFFQKKNLIKELTTTNEEKELKKIFAKYQKDFSGISGVCLLMFSDSAQKNAKKTAKEYFQSFIFQIKKIGFQLTQIKTKISSFSKQKKDTPPIEVPPEKSPLARTEKKAFSMIFNTSKKVDVKKTLLSAFILISILILGSFIFQKQEKQNIETAMQILKEIESKTMKAENALIFKDEERARLLFQEALEDISAISIEKSPIKDDVLALKNTIEQAMSPIYNMEKINEPSLFFEFTEQGFDPQKLIVKNSIIYLSNPSENDIYKIQEQKPLLINTNETNKLSYNLNDNILFFSDTNQLSLLENNEISKTITMEFPYSDFNPQYVSSFSQNLYFLDSNKGDIAKSIFDKNETKLEIKIWLNPKTKKPIAAKSIAVDGNLWILTQDNKIDRYHNGEYKETLDLNFFPVLENPSKIWTSSALPYLYILEPAKNRIIILNKNGEIIKQFQSDKFNNLKDFTVSMNGNKIYLLNNSKIFQITP